MIFGSLSVILGVFGWKLERVCGQPVGDGNRGLPILAMLADRIQTPMMKGVSIPDPFPSEGQFAVWLCDVIALSSCVCPSGDEYCTGCELRKCLCSNQKFPFQGRHLVDVRCRVAKWMLSNIIIAGPIKFVIWLGRSVHILTALCRQWDNKIPQRMERNQFKPKTNSGKPVQFTWIVIGDLFTTKKNGKANIIYIYWVFTTEAWGVCQQQPIQMYANGRWGEFTFGIELRSMSFFGSLLSIRLLSTAHWIEGQSNDRSMS